MPTVLDTLLVSVRSAADYNHDDAVAPAVVLWPDEKREFGRLLPRLRLALPQLLTFEVALFRRVWAQRGASSFLRIWAK